MSVSDHDRAEEVSAHGMRYCQDGNSQSRARPMNCRKNESMVIPDEQIAEFIKHWKNAFDEVLTPAEARVRAMQLVELYKLVGTQQRSIEGGVLTQDQTRSDAGR